MIHPLFDWAGRAAVAIEAWSQGRKAEVEENPFRPPSTLCSSWNNGGNRGNLRLSLYLKAADVPKLTERRAGKPLKFSRPNSFRKKRHILVRVLEAFDAPARAAIHRQCCTILADHRNRSHGDVGEFGSSRGGRRPGGGCTGFHHFKARSG